MQNENVIKMQHSEIQVHRERIEELNVNVNHLQKEISNGPHLCVTILKKVSTTLAALLSIIGTAIITVVGHIMKHTKRATCLKFVVDAIFKSKIFGEPETLIMLHSLQKTMQGNLCLSHGFVT